MKPRRVLWMGMILLILAGIAWPMLSRRRALVPQHNYAPIPTGTSRADVILQHLSAVQADASSALYVIEFGASGRKNVVRLSLDRDNKLVRDTLLSKGGRFFGIWDRHRLVLERFIVTQLGGVIDIRARKVIHDEEHGHLLGVVDGKVVYEVAGYDDRMSRRTRALYFFDLSTRNFGKIKSGDHWDLPGVKSPDKKMSVMGFIDGVIRLYQLRKAPKVLAKGFCFTYREIVSVFHESPCLWLDDERILTAQSNGKLVILGIQGTVEKVIEIKEAPAEVSHTPKLWLDKQGKIIYTCDKHFLIDVRNGTATPLKNRALGHGFEVSVAVDQERRRTVYHDGKAIGNWVLDPWRTEAGPGLLAFAYVEPSENANLGYPDGVAVWSARVGDWRTIKMPVDSLTGWSK